ncbi:hemolysin XhlA family protein [Paenibacillus sp. FA6]|uniref:hemolysin XhlA family protein n=1 Tax=Paenibacillus sp. FA6 TaxID=3413029 RepID=UPI003F657C16
MDDVQSETLQRITRVETKVDNMDDKLDRAINASETAVKALSSADSAHKRINRIENNQTWLWRTFAGAFVLAIVTFIISGGLK